jgi:hypothetical protein
MIFPLWLSGAALAPFGGEYAHDEFIFAFAITVISRPQGAFVLEANTTIEPIG